MACSCSVACFALTFGTLLESVGSSYERQYCIIGAGAAGLQLGYLLQSAGRDYIIFERNASAGAFFELYPRHRRLTSVNNWDAGTTNNKEVNLRQDWHSLLSHDDHLLMRHYSSKVYPHADEYVNYLSDYAERLGLNVQYNTQVMAADKYDGDFVLTDQGGKRHICQVLIVSTGISLPNIPTYVRGMELTVGYEAVSTDPADFIGKAVLVLGKGASALETAKSLIGFATYVHMFSRSSTRHGGGAHMRVEMNQMIGGQFDHCSVPGEAPYRIALRKDGKLHVERWEEFVDEQGRAGCRIAKNPRKPYYDVIIRCLGFRFDFSPFRGSVPLPPAAVGGGAKYPAIRPNYEGIEAPHLFVAGTISNALHFRKSSGGFVHGFRYTARALFRHLEWRYHSVPWPSATLLVTGLLQHMLKRISDASGPYNMFGVLADVAVINDDGTVEYLEEVPIRAISIFHELTGHHIGPLILWTYQNSLLYSGPGQDALRESRTRGGQQAGMGDLLHPVVYYYETPTQDNWNSHVLPAPSRYHIMGNANANRTQQQLPLREFLGAIFQSIPCNFCAVRCIEPHLGTHSSLTCGRDIPLSCGRQCARGNSTTWRGCS